MRKLNDTILHDPFPTPFINEVLEGVRGQEVYSFIDGFSGYQYIRIVKKDRHKTTFVIEWGFSQYTMMPFVIKNDPAIFSRLVVVAFKYLIHKFFVVYMDECTVCGLVKYHTINLWLMLERCRQHHISLNLKKCIFCAPFQILLGHIVCKEDMLVDLAKITIIVDLPPPMTVKNLRATLGNTRYY